MRSIIDTTFGEVLTMTWPTLFIAVVLVVTIRIGYLLKHKEEFVFYKEMLYLCFMLYILCLFQIVTAEDLNATNGNNFQLFNEIFRYQFGGRLFFKNIVGNVLMFVPYGFFASLYVDIKHPLKAFALIFAASLSIEITQLAIGRVFDVDDILLNVTGGMIGFIIYYLLDKISNLIPILKKEIVLNIITIIVLVSSVAFIIWR
ncbi:MAG: VanZ family protein [Bacilli bacterium]|nr:VanZ family protein [Bacilli bacterium]